MVIAPSEHEKDTYLTISKTSEGMFKDRGSRFLAYAHPLKDENEFRDILAGLRKEHHAARHWCYAYRLGDQGEVFRMNDDGEPSGTAGKPIYGQILNRGLTFLGIVVVRYFGGIKLGTSGLISAYRTAASEALDNATMVERIISEEFSIDFAYKDMNTIMRLIRDMGAEVTHSRFDERCFMEVSIRRSHAEVLLKRLTEVDGTNIIR